jgi:hypothetical protein
MARTNRDYWMACVRACVGALFITVAFSALGAAILRNPAGDPADDIRKVAGLWGALAFAVPLLLFMGLKKTRQAEVAEPASVGTTALTFLLAAGFTIGLTAVAWLGLWAWHGTQQLGGRQWPTAFLTSFVDSCSAKAPRPFCVCLADHLQKEGSALDATLFTARVQAGDAAAVRHMNELRAQCLPAVNTSRPPRTGW